MNLQTVLHKIKNMPAQKYTLYTSLNQRVHIKMTGEKKNKKFIYYYEYDMD